MPRTPCIIRDEKLGGGADMGDAAFEGFICRFLIIRRRQVFVRIDF
jgi:hypothetical protein